MKPPYRITSRILNLVALIYEKLGEIKSNHLIKQKPELRRKNRIKTIHSTLEIEGNTLSVNQITALFDNKRVIGPENEIIEVKNAINVYDLLETLNPFSVNSFLNAHKCLMNNLLVSAGKFRKGSVGIARGKSITHIAPPAANLNGLIRDLFSYLANDDDPLLIKSCVVHYEIEFIHPFDDGNGRMGRLWQSLILGSDYEVFKYIPIESAIKNKQNDYYKVLSGCDQKADSSDFIVFMLEIIAEQLEDLLQTAAASSGPVDRLQRAEEIFKSKRFSRKEYMRQFKNISAPTASRDLKLGVNKNMLIKQGDKRLAVYCFVF